MSTLEFAAKRVNLSVHEKIKKPRTPAAREVALVRAAIIDKCPDTNLYVGYVPDFPGAHSQGETRKELNKNLREVIKMLLENGDIQRKVC